jgi:hypothetical protein
VMGGGGGVVHNVVSDGESKDGELWGVGAEFSLLEVLSLSSWKTKEDFLQ